MFRFVFVMSGHCQARSSADAADSSGTESDLQGASPPEDGLPDIDWGTDASCSRAHEIASSGEPWAMPEYAHLFADCGDGSLRCKATGKIVWRHGDRQAGGHSTTTDFVAKVKDDAIIASNLFGAFCTDFLCSS